MKFYHGTKDGNLKELVKNHSRDGFVYINSNRNYALVYATRKYINLFQNIDNKIYFFNIYPDLFKKLYFNEIGYIYDFDLELEDIEKVPIGAGCAFNDSYRTKNNIHLNNKEKLNVYNEFMKLKEQGIFSIIENEDDLLKIRENYSNVFSNLYNENKLTEEEIEYFDKFIPKLIKKNK